RIAILDWTMPELEGVEICRRVRARAGRAYTFLMLLTAHSQKHNLLLGLNAGADDYLAKPFDVDELRARLRVGERILRTQDELIAARDALHFQATHDVLTGASSRGAAVEFLTRELARSQREKSPVGIVLCDVDHFKKVNDSYGHLAGDSVLQEITQRMTKSVRPYDCIGRYGGEEFLIIFPGCDGDAAFRQAERIRKCINSAPVQTAEGAIAVSASFGVVAFNPAVANSVAQLLRDADAALYRAKSLGRNRCERSSEIGEQCVPANRIVAE
ncbi:MAG TPA: diguanylate cyclase, partial [Candidatus Acidoferrales bacterium]|nr:diguanylate cyclase [Candidatus Acidoferrales bacterium]